MTGDIDLARAFADADASGRSSALAAYLDTVAGLMAEHKRTSIEAMGLRPGDAALDVGCGTGEEVRLIAERVGAAGRAVGVDASGDLVAAARERTPAGMAAEFVVADAHALPFEDGEFAAARVERTLQHVADPADVIAEMARVVRPGGRVVAAEPDWDTLVISSDDHDTTRAIRDEVWASGRNPMIGRAVAGYFADAGIAVNSVDAEAVVVRDATAARAMFLLDGAVERIGTDVARRWLRDLDEQSERGAFCAGLTVFRIVGTIPGASAHMRESVDVQLLSAAASDDATLMQRITDLVNDVYVVAEDGLWIDGATRTTTDEVARLTRAGEIAVARLGGHVVGCVRVQRLDERTGEFGMLAADPAHRGVGIGRELLRFAERKLRADGLRAVQLELLVPRGWTHPTKEFLAAWYTRIGYRIARTGTIDEAYPALAPLLATPCDFVIYRKDLVTTAS